MFSIISDLHITNNINAICTDIKINHIDNINIYLLIAGDICSPMSSEYWDFLYICCTYYKKVIVCLGNHEYYGYKMSDIDKYVKNHIKPSNLYILLNDIYIDEINQFIIYGTTLFSQITHNHSLVKNSISDFIRIYINDHTMTINDMNNIFDVNKSWLNNIIDGYKIKYPNFSHIVLSHHLPSISLTDNTIIDQAYASNLIDIINKVNLWICGHSHKKKY